MLDEDFCSLGMIFPPDLPPQNKQKTKRTKFSIVQWQPQFPKSVLQNTVSLCLRQYRGIDFIKQPNRCVGKHSRLQGLGCRGRGVGEQENPSLVRCLVEITKTLQKLQTCHPSEQFHLANLSFNQNDTWHFNILPMTCYQTSWNSGLNKLIVFVLFKRKKSWKFQPCFLMIGDVCKILSELDHFNIFKSYSVTTMNYCGRGST